MIKLILSIFTDGKITEMKVKHNIIVKLKKLKMDYIILTTKFSFFRVENRIEEVLPSPPKDYPGSIESNRHINTNDTPSSIRYYSQQTEPDDTPDVRTRSNSDCSLYKAVSAPCVCANSENVLGDSGRGMLVSKVSSQISMSSLYSNVSDTEPMYESESEL